MKKSKPKHGGARAGAGRPQGSTRGRTVANVCICLPPDVIETTDKLRGHQSRSGYITEVLETHLMHKRRKGKA
jgi:hypothetical protein